MTFVQDVFRLIKNDAHHSIFRKRFEHAVNRAVTRASGADDEHRAVGVIDQNIRVGKNAERRRVNDHVIEHLARLTQNLLEFRSRNKLGNVRTRLAAGCRQEPYLRLAANDFETLKRAIDARLRQRVLRLAPSGQETP